MTAPCKPRGAEASVLLAVLTVCAVLGLTLFTTGLLVSQDLQLAGQREGEFRARQLAGMALAIAAHPGAQPGDPLLKRSSGIEGFEGSRWGEDRLPNLNRLLNPEDRQVLEALFGAWGMGAADASALTDALSDWTDEDELPNLSGAEARAYADAGLEGRPFNRPFESMEEVRLVLGAEALDAVRPGWEEELSLFSSSTLDLGGAGAEAIRAFTGCAPGMAERFVRRRMGADRLPDTPDDVPPADLRDALTQLGIPEQAWPELQRRVGIKSRASRFVGRGWSGDATWRIEVVGVAGPESIQVYRVMEGRDEG